MEKPGQSVTVRRILDASPEELYAAWTDAELMALWMGKVVEASGKVGGRYRIEHDAGGGQVYVHKGEYRVLEPGRRIVMTFAAGPADREPPQGAPESGDMLEIRFNELDDEQTEVTLINSWGGDALDAEGMAAVEQAWSHWLDLLDASLDADEDD
jgi:uncharacterized protein YndB with AHSA1/START domain